MINDKAILVGVDGSHASYKATDCLRIFPAELCRRFVRCHLHGDGGR